MAGHQDRFTSPLGGERFHRHAGLAAAIVAVEFLVGTRFPSDCARTITRGSPCPERISASARRSLLVIDNFAFNPISLAARRRPAVLKIPNW
ncbi:hypothetical protein [Massilia aquatica]|uniref:Uncharacterized protein n=1 Tax=Massilia aquatica TaxID=2609000 RepID=A0ABX0MAI5_9BURK|nr:hypothetical protein [Massilia aquatica]NHZ41101.1 hypothetical protein [Massilia aquatica]